MLLSTCNMQEFAKIIIIFIFTDIPDSSCEEETEDKVVKKKSKTPNSSKYVH